MEMVKKVAGVEVVHIPYKGSGPALIDVIAGHVPVMFDSVVSSSPHVKAGKLRALAVTTSTAPADDARRADDRRSGPPRIRRVHLDRALYARRRGAGQGGKAAAEVARILKLPDIMERFAAQGAIIPETMTQAQAAAFIDADIAGYRKFILEANIKPE